jgi:hypothetical protein
MTPHFNQISSLLFTLGLIMILIGLLLKLVPHTGLPGDILIQRKNFTFYFPIVSCIIVSIILTFLLSFLKK